MAATVASPLSIPETEEAQIRVLHGLIQSENAKLIGMGGREVALPPVVRGLLLVILENLQSGNAISIVPEQRQLTTQRAADILGVSRPFLVGLVEAGQIPFHMVGRHRRIYLNDLLAYKARRDSARHEAINNMAKAELEAGTYDTVVLPDGAEEE
jgi:excisionase family DNA binding protein